MNTPLPTRTYNPDWQVEWGSPPPAKILRELAPGPAVGPGEAAVAAVGE